MDRELERAVEALEVGATSRRFPRCFSLPRALVLASELLSSSSDVSGGASFLYGTGGNVVIKTQSILNLLDGWDVCDGCSLARLYIGG